MSSTFVESLTMVTVTCCECRVVFAMPESWNSHFRKTHDWFYCPAGHKQHYIAESEAERLQRQVAQLQTTIERKEAYEQTLRNQVRQQRLKCAAVRGVVTRIKRRVHAGVCPCCNRTFQNVARHMETMHPERNGHA